MNTHQQPPVDEPGLVSDLQPLCNLVYCSRAAADVDGATVAHIVSVAQRRNAEGGITGMLVFGSGVFFQWLEGPRNAVLTLMALIRSDRRHENIVQLSENEEVRERLFPTWEMELVSGDHIRDVLQDALDSASDPVNHDALRQLLAHLDAAPLSQLHPG